MPREVLYVSDVTAKPFLDNPWSGQEASDTGNVDVGVAQRASVESVSASVFDKVDGETLDRPDTVTKQHEDVVRHTFRRNPFGADSAHGTTTPLDSVDAVGASRLSPPAHDSHTAGLQPPPTNMSSSHVHVAMREDPVVSDACNARTKIGGDNSTYFLAYDDAAKQFVQTPAPQTNPFHPQRTPTVDTSTDTVDVSARRSSSMPAAIPPTGTLPDSDMSERGGGVRGRGMTPRGSPAARSTSGAQSPNPFRPLREQKRLVSAFISTRKKTADITAVFWR